MPPYFFAPLFRRISSANSRTQLTATPYPACSSDAYMPSFHALRLLLGFQVLALARHFLLAGAQLAALKIELPQVGVQAIEKA